LFSQLTEEVPMRSIPKVVGVMSCVFLLCLGLSGIAALATDEMQPGQPPDRKGGQAGMKGPDEMLKGVAADSADHRMGGQAGMKSPDEMLKGVTADTADHRMGGQAGHKGAEDVLERSPAKK
jgi:hypothetical protein